MKKFVTTVLAASFGLAMAGTAAADSVSLNVSVPDADNSYIFAAAQEFKSRVEQYSNGEISIRVFPNGSLYGGDGNAAVSSLGGGSLDIVILAASLYASFNPSFYVMSIPYLFDDTNQLLDYINSEDGVNLFNSVESMGITCMGRLTRSFRQVTNSKRPINEPSDLEGLVMRTPSNTMYVEFFRACGANVTPMNFSEVYNALQLATLDGQENPIDVPATSNFYEVQKYVSMTNHIADAWVVGMNTAKLNSLSDSQQQALRQAASELQQWYVDYQAQRDADMLKLLVDNGMEANEVSSENMAKFVAVSQGLYPVFRDLVKDDALFDATLKFVGKAD